MKIETLLRHLAEPGIVRVTGAYTPSAEAEARRMLAAWLESQPVSALGPPESVRRGDEIVVQQPFIGRPATAEPSERATVSVPIVPTADPVITPSPRGSVR